jgi:hypothetical protein
MHRCGADDILLPLAGAALLAAPPAGLAGGALAVGVRLFGSRSRDKPDGLSWRLEVWTGLNFGHA